MNSQAIRTQGDGIEADNAAKLQESNRRALNSTSSAENEKLVEKIGREFICLSKKIQSPSSSSSYYNASTQHESVHNFPREVKPTGKKFYLIPRLVNKSSSLNLKNKNPRLILFEPYRVSIN